MLSVVIGGSGSGKSEYAEDYIVQYDKRDRSSNLIYIATMQPFDEESRLRIKKHQGMRRDKNFTTIECFTDLKIVEVEPHSSILLECMSNLVANVMFSKNLTGQCVEETTEYPAGSIANHVVGNTIGSMDVYITRHAIVEEIIIGVNRMIQKTKNVVIVTNNIFEDGIAYDSTTQEYMKTLGEINLRICGIANRVIEVVHGIPILIKDSSNNLNVNME